MNFPEKLKNKIDQRRFNNQYRQLVPDSPEVDFTSNDYLGFSKNEQIYENALQLVKTISRKNGSSGSRLLSGNSVYAEGLEAKLAAFYKANTALLFNSGYNANVGFFSSIPQREDVIFYDEYIHASIREGISLSNAKSYKFKHNSTDDLKQKRERIPCKGEVYVVLESVFSMDGDMPNLPLFADFCKKNNAFMVVDEAHAVGIFGKGKGIVCELNLEDLIFARVATFGKALGCHGAAILGSSELREYLINFSKSFIYTTSLPPHALATLEAAHNAVSTPGYREALFDNVNWFGREAKRLDLESLFVPAKSQIQSCIISGVDKTKYIAKSLWSSGFDVRPILSPTVPQGKERLRFCIHSYNSKQEISSVLEALQKLT